MTNQHFTFIWVKFEGLTKNVAFSTCESFKVGEEPSAPLLTWLRCLRNVPDCIVRCFVSLLISKVYNPKFFYRRINSDRRNSNSPGVRIRIEIWKEVVRENRDEIVGDCRSTVRI